MSDETYLMIPFEMMIGEWMRVDVRMLLHVSTLSPFVAHASSGKRKSVRRRKKKKTIKVRPSDWGARFLFFELLTLSVI